MSDSFSPERDPDPKTAHLERMSQFQMSTLKHAGENPMVSSNTTVTSAATSNYSSSLSTQQYQSKAEATKDVAKVNIVGVTRGQLEELSQQATTTDGFPAILSQEEMPAPLSANVVNQSKLLNALAGTSTTSNSKHKTHALSSVFHLRLSRGVEARRFLRRAEQATLKLLVDGFLLTQQNSSGNQFTSWLKSSTRVVFAGLVQDFLQSLVESDFLEQYLGELAQHALSTQRQRAKEEIKEEVELKTWAVLKSYLKDVSHLRESNRNKNQQQSLSLSPQQYQYQQSQESQSIEDVCFFEPLSHLPDSAQNVCRDIVREKLESQAFRLQTKHAETVAKLQRENAELRLSTRRASDDDHDSSSEAEAAELVQGFNLNNNCNDDSTTTEGLVALEIAAKLEEFERELQACRAAASAREDELQQTLADREAQLKDLRLEAESKEASFARELELEQEKARANREGERAEVEELKSRFRSMIEKLQLEWELGEEGRALQNQYQQQLQTDSETPGAAISNSSENTTNLVNDSSEEAWQIWLDSVDAQLDLYVEKREEFKAEPWALEVFEREPARCMETVEKLFAEFENNTGNYSQTQQNFNSTSHSSLTFKLTQQFQPQYRSLIEKSGCYQELRTHSEQLLGELVESQRLADDQQAEIQQKASELDEVKKEIESYRPNNNLNLANLHEYIESDRDGLASENFSEDGGPANSQGPDGRLRLSNASENFNFDPEVQQQQSILKDQQDFERESPVVTDLKQLVDALQLELDASHLKLLTSNTIRRGYKKYLIQTCRLRGQNLKALKQKILEDYCYNENEVNDRPSLDSVARSTGSSSDWKDIQNFTSRNKTSQIEASGTFITNSNINGAAAHYDCQEVSEASSETSVSASTDVSEDDPSENESEAEGADLAEAFDNNVNKNSKNQNISSDNNDVENPIARHYRFSKAAVFSRLYTDFVKRLERMRRFRTDATQAHQGVLLKIYEGQERIARFLEEPQFQKDMSLSPVYSLRSSQNMMKKISNSSSNFNLNLGVNTNSTVPQAPAAATSKEHRQSEAPSEAKSKSKEFQSDSDTPGIDTYINLNIIANNTNNFTRSQSKSKPIGPLTSKSRISSKTQDSLDNLNVSNLSTQPPTAASIDSTLLGSTNLDADVGISALGYASNQVSSGKRQLAAHGRKPNYFADFITLLKEFERQPSATVSRLSEAQDFERKFRRKRSYHYSSALIPLLQGPSSTKKPATLPALLQPRNSTTTGGTGGPGNLKN